MNLYFNLLFNSLTLLFKVALLLIFLKSKISDSDKAKNDNRIFKKIEIKEEYIIWGNWYMKLKEPWSS